MHVLRAFDKRFFFFPTTFFRGAQIQSKHYGAGYQCHYENLGRNTLHE